MKRNTIMDKNCLSPSHSPRKKHEKRDSKFTDMEKNKFG